MTSLDQLDLGHLITGVVKVDLQSGRYVIEVLGDDEQPSHFDVQAVLAKYEGQEVRLTLASMATLAMIQHIVEQGGGQGL